VPARLTLPGPPTLIVLLLAAVALLIGASGIPVRFPFNLNEGWNALHALDAMSGRNPYLPDGYANYPNYLPPWFYLLGWLGNLVGDHVMAGRIVALLSQVIIAINIGRAALALGADRDGALLAGGLFVLFGALGAPGYFGMADPQWFAHAIQSFALVLLLKAGDGLIKPATLIAIFALLLAGGLVKHNLAALPLAVTIWLALRDRRALTRWLGLAAITLPLLALLGHARFGPGLFDQVFGHRRVLALGQLTVGGDAVLFLAPVVLVAAFAAWRQRTTLAGLYLAASLIVGAVFGVGVGVHANTWFDLSIAALPLLGLAATRSGFVSRGWLKTAQLPSLLAAALVAAAIIGLLPRAVNYAILRVEAPQAAVKLAPILAAIAAADGAVACEDPTFCYWAGRPNAVDFTNLGPRLALDPAEEAGFIAWLDTRPLALIQLYEATTGRLTSAANAALLANYTAAVTAPVHLYQPAQ
jgi:hypothetical protein